MKFFDCPNDAPPNSLINSTMSPKVKTTKEKGVGVCFLTHSISGVDGRVKALGWGLRQVISGLIIHIGLHKPNNKLVSAYLNDFWCTDEPHAYTN
jgi:hypothetical protein